MMHRLLTVLLLSAAALPGAAEAQDIYAGAVYETGSGSLSVGESFDTDVQSFVGLAGVRFSVSGPIFAAGEVEHALSFDFTDDGEVYTDTDGTQRYRALAGVEVSGFSVFLSAGQARFETPTETYSGASLGIGVEMNVSDRLTVRVEAIHDDLSESDSGYSLENQSIRAGAIFNF